MIAAVWDERPAVPTNRVLQVTWLAVCDEANQGIMRNREKNLVKRWCEDICAHFRSSIEVFEVGIGGDLEGLHSLVRLATFNRDKNLISEIWAGVR